MLTVLITAVPFIFLGIGVFCYFFCSGCEERRKEAARIDMQMQVARDLQRLARKERESKNPTVGVFVVKEKVSHGS